MKENSLLWKVTGNSLKEPSYLFGTYHFLSNGFVDTIPAIKKAYAASDAVVGELIIDASIQRPMMEASVLQGLPARTIAGHIVHQNISMV